MFRPIIQLALALLLCAQAVANEPGPFEPATPKEHTVVIDASRHNYSIEVGGTADMDNTLTEDYWTDMGRKGRTVIAFQNNVSLTVENTGAVPVVNPRIVTNDRGRWWSIEAMAAEATRGGRTDMEKMLLVWQFLRRNNTHAKNFYRHPEHDDPVRQLNAYGQCLCGNLGWCMVGLCKTAGIGKVDRHGARHMGGHVMSEIYVDGSYRFMDVDEENFCLDLENEHPVSGDVIARDHWLMRRTHVYGPGFHPKGWKIGMMGSSLLGRDDTFSQKYDAGGHNIEHTLRPGERLVYLWADGEKTVGSVKLPHPRALLPNCRRVYRAPMTLERLGGVKGDDAADLIERNGRLAGAMRKAAHLTIAMPTPYVWCGGRLTGTLEGGRRGDSMRVLVSLDGKAWKEAVAKNGRGQWPFDVDITERLDTRSEPPRRLFFVRVELTSAGEATARLKALEIAGEFLCNPFSLPRLRVGENAIEYTDDTEGPHEIAVTHRWRESDRVQPPPPPQLTFPADEATVRRTAFDYTWRPVDGASKYHIQVSRYDDFRLPYVPGLDVFIDDASHGHPFRGRYSPGVDYYWRVRARSAEGLWGPWSEARRFRWEGPRVPVDVTATRLDDGRWRLSWKANPRGPRPVKYAVYGSDEKGFRVSRKPFHTMYEFHHQPLDPNTPANFLKETTDTECIVVDPAADAGAMNRSHYRVTAIDEHGAESGPSDFAELPHPHIYSTPVTEAAAGKPYAYEPKTLRSIGDLQYRNPRKGSYRAQFWEREGYVFSLEKAPKWLSIDADSGKIAGTPTPADRGRHEIVIKVKRTYPHEVDTTERRNRRWDKSADKYQAEDRQTFTIEVK